MRKAAIGLTATPAVKSRNRPRAADPPVRVLCWSELTEPKAGYPEGTMPDPKPSKLVPPSIPSPGASDDFTIPVTEMYNEPFGVPLPDSVIFFSTWKTEEQFRSGCVWKVGQGRVFYFRPGHETYPIFFQPTPRKIIANAARWYADRT